jgi:pimeloyl-ACP methyl ester carboxylesterase
MKSAPGCKGTESSGFFRNVNRLVVLALCLTIGFNQTDSIAEPTGQMVSEPIFNSKVYLKEHGKQHRLTLVLVHGTGSLGAQIWDSVIAELKESFHILTFDLPGFGRSEKANELYSPANYARFLKWVIDTRSSGPVYLVGHSMGGAIALYYAGIYPQSLDRLILIDAAGILHRATYTKAMLDAHFNGELRVGEINLLEKPLSALKNMVNSTIENVDNSLVPEEIGSLLESATFRNAALKGDPIRISGMALIQTDFSVILEKVQVPTIILWGERDTIAPLRTAKLLACVLNQASLSVFSGLNHNPMLEDPETFNTMLIQSILDPVVIPFPKITAGKIDSKPRTSRLINDQTDEQLTGTYERIKIKNSRNITLTATVVQQIEIENSEVSIINSLVQGKEFGMRVSNSIVSLTGVKISGENAIQVDNSQLDIAGSVLQGTGSLVRSENKSTIVFSVTKIEGPESNGYVHRIIRLNQGDSF